MYFVKNFKVLEKSVTLQNIREDRQGNVKNGNVLQVEMNSNWEKIAAQCYIMQLQELR